MVSGPGQKRSASLMALFGTSRTHRGRNRGLSRCTISGWLLGLAELRDYLAVEREHEIAGLQQRGRRRAAHGAHYRQHLSLRGAVTRELRRPLRREAHLPRARERLGIELDIEGMQRLRFAYAIAHIRHDIDRLAAQRLRDAILAVISEGRPGPEHLA